MRWSKLPFPHTLLFVLCLFIVIAVVAQFVVVFVVLPVVIAYVKIMLFHNETTSHRMCSCHADIACPARGSQVVEGGGDGKDTCVKCLKS